MTSPSVYQSISNHQDEESACNNGLYSTIAHKRRRLNNEETYCSQSVTASQHSVSFRLDQKPIRPKETVAIVVENSYGNPAYSNTTTLSTQCLDTEHIQHAGIPQHITTDSVNDVPAWVCYGSIDSFFSVPVNGNYETDDCLWDGESQLILPDGRTAQIPEQCVEVLTALHGTGELLLEFHQDRCSPEKDTQFATAPRQFHAVSSASISFNVYGPGNHGSDLGSWLTSIDLFLQRPRHCHYDCPYQNPQIMSTLNDRVVMTSEINVPEKEVPSEVKLEAITDCLEAFSSRKLSEAAQPHFLCTRLKPHQLQALSFLQGREMGWDFYDTRHTNDLWQCRLDRFQREKYFLTTSQESRFKPPPEFGGGILADEMGLGKTCTMLGLIVAGLKSRIESNCTNLTQPTLIVVPLPLLQVWEKQIDEHVLPNCIRTITHHGSSSNQVRSFASSDIVLTTYDVVAKEWKIYRRQQNQLETSLFDVQWHRVILDEAHTIRNASTEKARAVSALDAVCRWCITGTPVQNRLSDLASLLRFLRVYPYDDNEIFESTFVKPWTQHNDEGALRRLQTLVSTITIRRSREIITLPDRCESIINVDFNDIEKQQYELARKGAHNVINEAVNGLAGEVAQRAFLNVLRMINDLRYICNHGIRPRQMKKALISANTVQEILIEHEMRTMLGDEVEQDDSCAACALDQPRATSDNELLAATKNSHTSELCLNCGRPRFTTLLTPPYSGVTSPESPGADEGAVRPSSKIRQLVREIEKVDRADKCVVFSYWTATLKAIAQALTDSKISYLIYDGSMTRLRRDGILTSFSSSPTVKVILVSISCGGQGLDLTSANHAFLVEPQWNPMLEEQAMARIHRLGQQKPCRLVRMIVKDSWEEKIVQLQDRKRLLADILMDNKRLNEKEHIRNHLLWLRDLVA